MIAIRKQLERRKIAKTIKPLNFIYDRMVYKDDIDYIIGWLNSLDISASNITKDNKYSNLLTLNITGDKGEYNLYCITLLMCSSAIICEEQLAEMKDEANKYNAIPVFITMDDLGVQPGLLARILGIQIINASQIEGLNRLIYENDMPSVNPDSALLIHKLAYYAHIKLAKLN